MHDVSDDFKISLDIEGNLTRLDSTLAQAEQKVTHSAMRMQTGIKNGIGEALASRLGLAVSSPMAAIASGAALAGPVVSRALNANVSQMISERGFRTAGSFGLSGGYGPYGAGEAARSIQSGIDNFQAPGLLGQIPYVNDIFHAYVRRQSEQRLKQGKSTFDFNALAQTADERAGLQRTSEIGFGGYKGEMAALDFDRQRSATHIQSVRMSQGNDAADKLQKDTERTLELQRQKIQFNRNNDLADIQSYTSQSRMGAMGLGKYADIMETRRSFGRGIALANKQGDKQLSGMLNDQMSAQVMEQFMGNISPAQELMAPQALGQGSVRLGSTSGQNDAYLAFLSKIAQNTTGGPPIGRN